jgi:N utilization substance protein B
MAKGKRREGRETALMFLFSADIGHLENASGEELLAALDRFWEFRPSRTSIREHALRLVKGVLTHRAELDRMIEEVSENYHVQRIAPVDRNILRLALYEMHHEKEVPPAVAINEAVDLAREFSDTKSSGFVNGLLDRLKPQS